jgi:hypothetical protein
MNLLWLLGFKLSWFALIFWQQAALLPVFFLWLLALWLLNQPQRLAVVVLTLLGIALDFSLVQVGVFHFAETSGVPLWMMLLWGCFACVAVKVFAVWFQPWYLAVLAGAISGPLAYWAGANLGGQLSYADLTQVCLILAPIWALLMSAICHFSYLWSETNEQKLA